NIILNLLDNSEVIYLD
ncbi:hypothetical protein CEXT_124901, partial [Caerostris extrusa]